MDIDLLAPQVSNANHSILRTPAHTPRFSVHLAFAAKSTGQRGVALGVETPVWTVFASPEESLRLQVGRVRTPR